MKQLYFSFISQLLELCEYCLGQHKQIKFNFYLSHQKHAIRIIYDKDHFAPRKSLFKYAKALKVYEIKLFQIFSLIFKCKNRTESFVFHSLCTLKPPSNFFLKKEQSLVNFLYIFVVPVCGTKFQQRKTFISNLQCYPLF